MFITANKFSVSVLQVRWKNDYSNQKVTGYVVERVCGAGLS